MVILQIAYVTYNSVQWALHSVDLGIILYTQYILYIDNKCNRWSLNNNSSDSNNT